MYSEAPISPLVRALVASDSDKTSGTTVIVLMHAIPFVVPGELIRATAMVKKYSSAVKLIAITIFVSEKSST